MLRFVLFPLLLVVLSLRLTPAHATPMVSTTITTVSHGMKLTLVVPQRAYPRNSLAKLPVTVRNVSRRTVLTSLGLQCRGTNPSIEVLNARGQIMPQEPTISYEYAGGCGRPIGEPFRPGKMRRFSILVLLNAARLRVVLQAGRYLNHLITSSEARVRLVPATPLVATIHQSSIGPYATVQRPPDARGPLYYVDSAECSSPANPGMRATSGGWTSTLYGRVYSGCYGRQDWHGFAGYLKYPVAEINYTSP